MNSLTQRGLFDAVERAEICRLDVIWSGLSRRGIDGVELEALTDICRQLIAIDGPLTVDDLCGHFAFNRATERRLGQLVRFGIVDTESSDPPRFVLRSQV